MAAEERKDKVPKAPKAEKKEKKKKLKDGASPKSLGKRERWKSECELDDCVMPGVALGPWPIRISHTPSYVLGQMQSRPWGGGDSDLGEGATEHLSNAGVWTETEAALVYYKKLKRLQSLYMGQAERLRHEFKVLRHRYLGQLQHIENGGTINSTAIMPYPGDNVTANLAAKRASAIRRYKRSYGHDAVMQWRVRERRQKARLAAIASAATAALNPGSSNTASASSPVESTGPKAAHCGHVSVLTGNCKATCLPLTRYCRQHICSDSSQCLFVPCEQVLSSGQRCGQPIPGYTAVKRCFLHVDLLPVRCEEKDVDDLHTKWTKLQEDIQAHRSGSSSDQGTVTTTTSSITSTGDIMMEGRGIATPSSKGSVAKSATASVSKATVSASSTVP